MKTRDTPKELGLFYVIFQTVTLYILWDQFINVQVTLTTPSHQVPLHFMVVLKRLHLNLLKIVTLLTLKVVLGDHPTRLKQYILSSDRSCKSQPSNKKEYCCPTCMWPTKFFLSDYSSALRSWIYYQDKTNGKKRTHGGSTNKYTWLGRNLSYLSLEKVKWKY